MREIEPLLGIREIMKIFRLSQVSVYRKVAAARSGSEGRKNPDRLQSEAGRGISLLGYENRKMRDEDFHDDKVSAGDIGAGHSVTALYEIVPVGAMVPGSVDKSRYVDNDDVSRLALRGDDLADGLMFVKLRYKAPDGGKSELLETPVAAQTMPMSNDFEFAAAVTLFGMLLRDSRYSGDGNWDTVLELAKPGDDKYRKEFVELVKQVMMAKPAMQRPTGPTRSQELIGFLD